MNLQRPQPPLDRGAIVRCVLCTMRTPAEDTWQDMNASTRRYLCLACAEDVLDMEENKPDDAPESVPSDWWSGGFAESH